ncbi:hypothetical protein [Flavobacterium luteum]|uniref:Urease accessory protein UreH-like transmembrane domain-containing protein n=1 Tax=Flavobacterium luteum TaxID=2026654 RepID=A0A7J5AIX4_9FLAO|nr:hypothetical protein [Flavobacterium luteum]KAB1157561.1 hypothetical protein F6464_00300 [Flavobacterium luteum]
MQHEFQIVLTAAITIACLHTITGPDHYLPFIALSKSRGWSFGKTLLWTIICGCGHVWSSVLLGLGGAAIGWNLSKISWLEGVRGGIAGWFMLLFGLLYCIWGLYRTYKNKSHKHFDTYDDGSIYVFEHKHGETVSITERHKVTPWVMFIIFLLGPCEPMIPLLFFPAAQHSWQDMLILIIVYTTFTLVTMIVMVFLGYYSISLFNTEKLEKHMHTLGGLTVFICGAGMVFTDW